MPELKRTIVGIHPEDAWAALERQEADGSRRLFEVQKEVAAARERLEAIRLEFSRLGAEQARLEATIQSLAESTVPVRVAELNAVLEAAAEQNNMRGRIAEMRRLAEGQREAQEQIRQQFARELLALINRFTTVPAATASVDRLEALAGRR